MNKMKSRVRRAVVTAICLLGGAAMSYAQTDNTVTLEFSSGEASLSGELLDFSNGNFRIRASVGVITVEAKGITCVGAACPEGTTGVAAGGGNGSSDKTVELTANDGSNSIIGTLVEIKDGKYVVSSDIGVVEIDVNIASCEGPGCPLLTPAEPAAIDQVDLTTLNGSTTITGKLLDLTPEHYTISHDTFGVIRIPVNSVECAGARCP